MRSPRAHWPHSRWPTARRACWCAASAHKGTAGAHALHISPQGNCEQERGSGIACHAPVAGLPATAAAVALTHACVSKDMYRVSRVCKFRVSARCCLPSQPPPPWPQKQLPSLNRLLSLQLQPGCMCPPCILAETLHDFASQGPCCSDSPDMPTSPGNVSDPTVSSQRSIFPAGSATHSYLAVMKGAGQELAWSSASTAHSTL